MRRTTLVALALSCGLALGPASAAASQFEACQADARKVSGYEGQEQKSAMKGALKGGLGEACMARAD